MKTSNVFFCAVLVVSAITQIHSAPPPKLLSPPKPVDLSVSKIETSPKEKFSKHFEGKVLEDPNVKSFDTNSQLRSRENNISPGDPGYISPEFARPSRPIQHYSEVQKEPVNTLFNHQPGTGRLPEPVIIILKPIANTGDFQFDSGFPKFTGKLSTRDESGHLIPDEFYPKTAEEAKQAAKKYMWVSRYEGIHRIIYEIPKPKQHFFQSLRSDNNDLPKVQDK